MPWQFPTATARWLLFFSPDGESVGFFAGGKLKRAAVTGRGRVRDRGRSEPLRWKLG